MTSVLGVSAKASVILSVTDSIILNMLLVLSFYFFKRLTWSMLTHRLLTYSLCFLTFA